MSNELFQREGAGKSDELEEEEGEGEGKEQGGEGEGEGYMSLQSEGERSILIPNLFPVIGSRLIEWNAKEDSDRL